MKEEGRAGMTKEEEMDNIVLKVRLQEEDTHVWWGKQIYVYSLLRERKDRLQEIVWYCWADTS